VKKDDSGKNKGQSPEQYFEKGSFEKRDYKASGKLLGKTGVKSGDTNGFKPSLEVNLGGIELKNPVLLASGPAGYGHEYREIVDFSSLGALIVKGISLEPWTGNPPPRLAETPSGLLNSVGLQNPGVEKFVNEDLPALRDCGTKIIVNVVGCSADEYAAIASCLEGLEDVAGLELNISCPNVKAGGIAFGTDPQETARVVEKVRRITTKPLLVKLSPNVTDITEVARAAETAGADVISLINTISGMLIDTERQKPLLGNVFGGLSGPAVMPVALKMVWQVAGIVNVPVIGMGGISSTDDALQFIMAGARAVALGTGLFYDPGLPAKINEGLSCYLHNKGRAGITDLEGVAREEKGESRDG